MSTMTLVEQIIANLEDRLGFRTAFDIDDDVMEELKDSLTSLIDAHLTSQEPVAEVYEWNEDDGTSKHCVSFLCPLSEIPVGAKLYAAPVAQEAVQPGQKVVAYRTRSKAHPRFVGNWVDGDIPPEHVAGEEEFYTIERAVLATPASLRTPPPSFQARVSWWMDQCFLPSLYCNMTERGDRLLEEVLELLQSHGYDRERVPTLVDYVYGRPVGVPRQEVGGVMVTLGGYCWIAGLDMHACGEAELARINKPEVMAKIRAKQEAKNALHFDTPLPGSSQDGTAG